MAQNRKAPAYQEYAATVLANKNYRLMSLSERGLLYSMKLECWENSEIPASDEMAKYLGCDQNEIKQAFTDRVKSFFTVSNDLLSCPELDDYRQHLDERKAKQSEGGKKGATKVNKKYKQVESINNTVKEGVTGNPQVPRRGRRESLVKLSTAKQSQEQSVEKGNIPITEIDEWIQEYESASNGSQT